jgi:hypothetical protein
MLGRGLPRVTIGYHVVARVSRKSRELARSHIGAPRSVRQSYDGLRLSNALGVQRNFCACIGKSRKRPRSSVLWSSDSNSGG